ncbi:uncharacterized protein B0H18DRAFT_1010485 [Fomitopsis serialis]|uniref:uncharacterized protein n=1 Tax=Fomitopsis serialis TaxID=139415 RepID=UPI00200725AC|nr:uncharacterized protein B0H18DRAFT_1010485 [Neoantrodia serialis]KAH9924858.1 hypothetical protein B0H18DRAFT_1010485 [Neoantrodia serialis]
MSCPELCVILIVVRLPVKPVPASANSYCDASSCRCSLFSMTGSGEETRRESRTYR